MTALDWGCAYDLPTPWWLRQQSPQRTEWGNDGRDRRRSLERTILTLPGISRLKKGNPDPAGQKEIASPSTITAATQLPHLLHLGLCSQPRTVTTLFTSHANFKVLCLWNTQQTVLYPPRSTRTSRNQGFRRENSYKLFGVRGVKAVWAGYLSEFRLPVRPWTFISVAASNLKVPATVLLLR